MAHAYEQTLLARLGFADPDRQNPMHENACRYLASPTGREAVARLFGPVDSDLSSSTAKLRQVVQHRVTLLKAERERTISKGKGHTRFTVGFLDVVVHLRYYRDEKVTDTETGLVRKQDSREISRPFLIEVKIQHENIGQVLRQVNLYRDFINDYVDSDLYDLKGYDFVLATRYEPTVEELETLEEADIYHLLIGKGFDNYMTQGKEFHKPAFKEV